MKFYTSLSEYYDLLFPPSQEQKEWAHGFAGPGPVLDAGCGTGELLLFLARKGIPGSGFDADEEMIRRAVEKSAGTTEILDFRKAALTEAAEVYPPCSFTALLCMGNTIAHVRDLEEMNRLIGGFASLLKEDGKLAVQILNYDRILANKPRELPPLTTETDDLKLRFLRRYRYEKEHIVFAGTLQVESREDKLEKSFETVLLPVRRKDLEAAFTLNGLENIRFLEDYGPGLASEESAVYLAIGEK